jgi:hypothetical protein
MDSRLFGLSVVLGRLKISFYPKPHGGDGCSGHPLPAQAAGFSPQEFAVVLELLNATIAGGTD